MPYYQFNSFTGRITESTRLNPLYPLAPNRLERADPPKIMFGTPDTKPVKVATATMATNAVSKSGIKYAPVDPRILKKMELFQAPNNIPVYLKGGPADKVLFGITVAMTAVGLVGCFKLFYDLGFPKK